MQNNIEIINKKNSVEVNIEGTIGVPEEWQFDDPQDRIATYDRFREAVDLIRQVEAPEIIVNIRSTGGNVNDALLIHDAISGLKAKKITRCYGYTASAATIIAQAASAGCRQISANALYLIHKAICAAEGNESELSGKLDLLRQTDERLAALYAARSGHPAAEFESLMGENNGDGRWLSPKEAVDLGLVDEIIAIPEVLNFAVVNEKPIHNYMVKIKNKCTGILRILGLTSSEGEAVEISEEQIEALNQSLEQRELHEQELQGLINDEKSAHQATKESLAGIQNRISELETELAQAKAKPTETKQVEDPSVTEAELKGNAKSYAEDIKNFK